MTYEITQHLTDVNKGKKGDNTPEWIIVHFVGAAGQAMANARFFKSLYRGASAHYFADPSTIAQVVEDDTPAWQIGDGHRTRQGKHNGYIHKGGATNTNSIGIEGCQDVTTGKDVWNWDFHPETVKRIEWLVKMLQKKYNIDDDHVIRHFDASGKNCPGNWSHNKWFKWEEFKTRLATGIKQPAPSATPKHEGKAYDDDMYLVEAGDTLSKIAMKTKVTMEKLILWNDLENPDLIFPETKLFITQPPSNKELNITKLAQEVLAGKHGNGAEREKSLGANFQAVQAEINNVLLGNKTVTQPKSVNQLAQEVLDGKWGSGDERKKALGSQYAAVQKRVNELLSGKAKTSNTVKAAPAVAPTTKTVDRLAREVIDGQHGTGEARKKALGSQFNAVQKRVNELLKTKTASPKKTVSQLADEVNKGMHGSGRERMVSLGNRYAEVQAEVNRRARARR